MSTVLPKKLSSLVDFVETHADIWGAGDPTAIGLTAGQVAALSAQLNNTTDAISNRVAAEENARNRVVIQNSQGAELHRLAAECIRSIKTFAEAQAKPSDIYEAASIPMPKPPTPAPAPAQPTDLTVAVDPASGALTLKWKCNNKGLTGVSYMVSRRAAGEAAFTLLGATGTKSYVDDTFTAGPDSVQYTVQGMRGGVEGTMSPIFTVNFGQAPGDAGVTATVTQTLFDGVAAGGGAKMAA